MPFVFENFAKPMIALLPMMLILVNYASRIRLPFGIPGGLLAVAIGTLFAWGLRWMGYPQYFTPSPEPYVFHFYSLTPSLNELFSFLASPRGWQYMAVIFPMGLFNVIGSLQNLESAEAAGDRYETRPSLLANGIGTLFAACFGSAFPTTIYIGHPGWKAMGARSGYSILNGVAITILCLIGGMPLVLKLIPLEATLGILLWIGLIITAQAFQETPKKHALAVAIGFIPSLAAWALILVETSLRKAGTSLFATAAKFGQDLYIHGVIALNQGFILTSMILAAILAFIIDRSFLQAGAWAGAAALLSAIGLIHAYDLTAAGIQFKFGWLAAPDFVLGYGLTAIVLVALHFWNKSQNLPSAESLRSDAPRSKTTSPEADLRKR